MKIIHIPAAMCQAHQCSELLGGTLEGFPWYAGLYWEESWYLRPHPAMCLAHRPSQMVSYSWKEWKIMAVNSK